MSQATNSFDPSVYIDIPAKPVIFDGVRYRSKLEAKWGFFFHHLEWDCSYEPVSIGKWLPDFVLVGKTKPRKPIFVEVKPIDVFEIVDKLAHIPNYFEILLVGNGPQNSRNSGYPRVGWLRNDGEWCDAMIQRYSNGSIDFTPDIGFDGRGRMFGVEGGGVTIGDALYLQEITGLWEIGCDAVKRDAVEI